MRTDMCILNFMCVARVARVCVKRYVKCVCEYVYGTG